MKLGSNYKCVPKVTRKFESNYWKLTNKRKNTNMSPSQDNTKIEYISKLETWWTISSDKIPKHLFCTWYKIPTITHSETYSYMQTHYTHTCTCGHTNTHTHPHKHLHPHIHTWTQTKTCTYAKRRYIGTWTQRYAQKKHIYEVRDRQTYTCTNKYTHKPWKP